MLSLIPTLKQQFIRHKDKEINIKSATYYFYNDMINIKNFDPSLLKIDKKSYKNIDIFYIGHITIKNLVIMKVFIV